MPRNPGDAGGEHDHWGDRGGDSRGRFEGAIRGALVLSRLEGNQEPLRDEEASLTSVLELIAKRHA
ncbi:MAG TPA: hypothetical protein VHX37_15600 [Acidobacteriaceae bacterium]|nr:hypothetical protein [Acidobacteriaceae bacterium]